MVIQSQKRDGVHWRKYFPASRQENGSFEVWPLRPIFFIFTKGGCTCFNGYFQRKKPKPSHVQIGQSQDDGFLEDFLAVRPET